MVTFKIGFVRVGHHEQIHHLERELICDELERFAEALIELRMRTEQSTGYRLYIRTIERVAETAQARHDQSVPSASR